MSPEEGLWLPLPKAIFSTFQTVARDFRHPGLLLDKFTPAAGSRAAPERRQEEQAEALRAVVETSAPTQLFAIAAAGRVEALSHLRAVSWECKTLGPLTLHLARAGALENAGIALHPIYGFAYLPGSGLKGVARAYAETVWHPAQADANAAWCRIEKVFGTTPGTAEGRNGRPRDLALPEDAEAGTVVFHDAWPLAWPSLVVDIVNNHHPDYYDNAGTTAPGDWENPNPVYFLAVPAGQAFSFALSRRRPEVPDGEIDLARQWLANGLATLGAGAKTNAGYGSFDLPANITRLDPPTPAFASFEGELELTSPAFFAGAEQTANDCDLRPATLRGLLRWWWRTLHSGFVDPKTLFAMESVVFGNTDHGGPLRLEIEPVGDRDREAVPYDRRGMRQRYDSESKDKRTRTTLGLHYVTYGMDENRGASRRRAVLSPGARWRVRLTARTWRRKRDARGEASLPASIDAQTILAQAQSALWLLCQFGGVGSKSRKGFGSLRAAALDLDLERCKKRADDFRRLVTGGARSFNPQSARSPALESALVMPPATLPGDPWIATHETGCALQAFSSKLRQDGRKNERAALGLPRLGADSPRFHRESGLARHASPILHHVEPAGDGTTLVRVIAFPSPDLPDLVTSRRVLQELIRHESTHFANVRPRAGPRLAPPHRGQRRPLTGPGHPSGGLRPPAPPAQLRAGAMVRIAVLEETTRSGRRKAHLLGQGSERRGYVENTGDLPEDAGSRSDGVEARIMMVPSKPQDDLKFWIPTDGKPFWPGYRPDGGDPHGADQRRGRPPRAGGRR